MAKGQKLEIQLPDTDPPPPSIHPDIADIRERLAAAESTLASRSTDSPAAAEALRLAAEAHAIASQALARAEAQAEKVTAPPEPPRVLEVDPPAPQNPLESIAELTPPPTDLEPRRAWWHPSRLL